MREQRNLQNQQRVSATVYEIPVVVHIIEPANGSSLNITDDRIFRQIEILNEDFRRTNADASNTPATFLPVAADTEIQFSLAKQDPAGNPTNGIVRTRGTKNRYSSLLDRDILRSETFWPPEHYLNMYVLDLQTFLGFASFPVTTLDGITNDPEDYILDGVLVDHQYFGENPNASAFESFGRTATHEVGHYLGLRHIWGDGGCGIDDFVSDTPEADNDNGGLSSPCTFPSNDSNVCVTDEMFQNYMDYTDDGCMNLFTAGQKSRMRTVLENSPRRSSLISSPALTEPIRFFNDLAIKEVDVPKNIECTNQIIPAVEVINYGTNPVNSFDLTLLINGLEAQVANHFTSLDELGTEVITFTPEIIAVTPVSLEFVISNVNGTTDGNESNNSQSITISSTSSISLPFAEDFESDLLMFGEVGASNPWEVATAPSESLTNLALQFKAFQNTTAFDDQTIIKTPVFDLTGLNSAEMSFSYAHAQIPNGFLDGLTIRVSTDCGETFTNDLLFNSYGDLATVDENPSYYIPQNDIDWVDTTINITQFANVDGLQFAFIGQNGGGNNIFLDDLSIIQTNLNAQDVSLLDVDAPLATCNAVTSVDFEIRNVGFQEITSISYQYTQDGVTTSFSESDLSIISGEFQRFSFDVTLEGGSNELIISVVEVNGSNDQDFSNNTVSYNVNRDLFTDSYPLIVDFETNNFWNAIPPGDIPIWRETSIGTNGALLANGFAQTALGAQDWFISPALEVGGLDSAGLSFKVSYAERIGFNDRLQVFMSIDCGENYTFELFNAPADSLAVVQSDAAWTPELESDWKEFKVDLKPSIIWRDDIRLAFVFTNGNGNNLYLDDINIGFKPEADDDSFIVFPNPARSRFNIAFSLSERDDIEVQLIDISGRIVLNQRYKNVLDQVYDFETVAQDGFYFVKVIGDKINKTERLYIRR